MVNGLAIGDYRRGSPTTGEIFLAGSMTLSMVEFVT